MRSRVKHRCAAVSEWIWSRAIAAIAAMGCLSDPWRNKNTENHPVLIMKHRPRCCKSFFLMCFFQFWEDQLENQRNWRTKHCHYLMILEISWVTWFQSLTVKVCKLTAGRKTGQHFRSHKKSGWVASKLVLVPSTESSESTRNQRWVPAQHNVGMNWTGATR
jgi:hypothetical protein